MDSKDLVGREVAKRVMDGDVIGIGTGSTVRAAVKAIGERIQKEGISIAALTTSVDSSMLCAEYGIRSLDPFSERDDLRFGFDGADEVDPQGRLIKGQGGAMLREKILAARCKELVIIVDDSKLVQRLGQRFPVPIEVIPEAWFQVQQRVVRYGADRVELRRAGTGYGAPVISERGNLILDAEFKVAGIKADAEVMLKSITGVVETGLFLNHATEVLVSSSTGVSTFYRRG
jgi:ribose 5-phosphate isomerase A